MPASFTSYEVTLVDGSSLLMRTLGSRLVFESSAERKYDVTLLKLKNSRVVKNFQTGGKNFDVDLISFMDEDTLYNVVISYEAYGMTVNNGDNLIFRNGNAIYFWRSENYEYNLGTTKELWTDDKSLKECLEPQNDIEADDPVIRGYAERIVKGAADDWEKVFRIYKFISSDMAYDKAQVKASAAGYQDSAIEVIRSGKAICEGFCNAFVALCRAQGIPAVVEFGIGFSDYNELTTRKPGHGDYADHAWAAVYLGGKWRFVDPTYDMARFLQEEKDVTTYNDSTKYYLLPLESFSNDHRIMDADTRHGVPVAGYCGTNHNGARFEITRDGVCHISGSGSLQLPAGITGFHTVVFEQDSHITEIGADCFRDCDLITVVILPDSVRQIKNSAFNTCEDLHYVRIPDNVDFIGEKAFIGCDELSYIKIPDSCSSIGKYAFEYCPRLYISVPSKLSDFAKDYDMKPMKTEVR